MARNHHHMPRNPCRTASATTHATMSARNDGAVHWHAKDAKEDGEADGRLEDDDEALR